MRRRSDEEEERYTNDDDEDSEIEDGDSEKAKPTGKEILKKNLSKEEVGDLIESHLARGLQLLQLFRQMN